MATVAVFLLPLVGAGYYLFVLLRAELRQKTGRCARCGVVLHPVHEPPTWVSESGSRAVRVCHRCAERTRWGWLFLLGGLLLLAGGIIATVELGGSTDG